MKENLIKSKKRVQKHGEVFMPFWMVQKILDTPGIKETCEDISATFVEPSAGDGKFLQAILERKLSAVIMQYDERSWKTKSLIALSSIYGIEFLEDNLEVARSRMFLYYLDWYEQIFSTKLTSRSDIYKSAYYLIHKNIVRGNTLTQRHPVTDELIWFNEWQLFKGHSSFGKTGQKVFKIRKRIVSSVKSLILCVLLLENLLYFLLKLSFCPASIRAFR